jgi:hypothetical protein
MDESPRITWTLTAEQALEVTTAIACDLDLTAILDFHERFIGVHTLEGMSIYAGGYGCVLSTPRLPKCYMSADIDGTACFTFNKHYLVRERIPLRGRYKLKTMSEADVKRLFFDTIHLPCFRPLGEIKPA